MPSRSNYICVLCEKEMVLQKAGVFVEEHMDDGSPYKIWAADLRVCPKCGHRCLVGFGNQPLAHHHDKGNYTSLQKQVRFHIR